MQWKQSEIHCIIHIWWQYQLLSGKKSTCQYRRNRRCSFNPWVGKTPCRRKWQPTPVFWPGKSHGQRILVGYRPWGLKRVGHNLATNQQWKHMEHFICMYLKHLIKDPLKLQYFGHLMQRVDSLENTLDAGRDWGEEEKGMTEDEMAGWHHWLDGRWVWVNSGSWWWIGRPGVLRFMGSQRVRHDWATELNWTEVSGIVVRAGYI